MCLCRGLMSGRICCVTSCRRWSHDHRGRRIPSGLSFYSFPSWRRNEGERVSELTRRRRAAWVAAVGRSCVTFDHTLSSMRVCSRHFHSGKPAYEMLESDPDWVPSLQLGHKEGDIRHTGRLLPSQQPETQRWTTGTRFPHESRNPAGLLKPPVRPWRDVKALLQRLQRQHIDQRLRDEAQQQPRTTVLSFREFFRDTLEASLEASSRPRTRSTQQPDVSEDSQSSTSSFPCLNCVRLQRTNTELQDKLSHLTGGQEDTDKLQPDQVLQSPETVHASPEEVEPAWTESVSLPLVGLQDRGQVTEVDSPNLSPPADPPRPRDNPSRRVRPRRPPRFQKVWLKKFWFLRYSAALDHMWCHVCRLHGDKSHQHLALIKGSRLFKIQNIKKHGNSNYHRDNVQRHLLAGGTRTVPLKTPQRTRTKTQL